MTGDKTLTLGSLFDGSGGFPLAGILAGVTPLWASEIEPFAVRVTTARLPQMQHYGDVSAISGADLPPVDIITFGSPCQDMSIAGKRSGLDGSRSSLFYEAIRIVKEMREKTNGEKPRFICWENVPGAFSSNKGEDFRAVLEAVIGIKEPTAQVPAPGKKGWPYADYYVGDGWSAAYRVLTSLTAARVDGAVPSTWGIYVQTKSKATLTINGAAGSYGSTISSYSITGGGYTSTASSLTTGFLNTSGTVTFTATVTDSRGRVSAAATVSISVVAYSPPSFASYLSQRCLSTGTVDDDGTYIRGLVSYSYASCSSKNTITRATYYKKASDTAWTNASTAFSSGTAFTFGGGKISTETSYDIKYTLTDAFTTIAIQDIVSTAAVVMDFKRGGKGVAVGKVSEVDNAFEVAEDWDVRVYGKLLKDYIQSFIKTMYPVGSIYMSVNATNPSTYFGGTWVAWGAGRVPVGINTSDSNFNTVEKTGGAATVTLTTAQMPAHTHTFTGSSATTSSKGAHTHNIGRDTDGGSGSSRYTVHSAGVSGAGGTSPTSSAGAHTHTVTANGTNANTGGGGAHSNLQPYIVCYMWKRTA